MVGDFHSWKGSRVSSVMKLKCTLSVSLATGLVSTQWWRRGIASIVSYFLQMIVAAYRFRTWQFNVTAARNIEQTMDGIQESSLIQRVAPSSEIFKLLVLLNLAVWMLIFVPKFILLKRNEGNVFVCHTWINTDKWNTWLDNEARAIYGMESDYKDTNQIQCVVYSCIILYCG